MRLKVMESPVMLKSHVEIVYSRLSEAPKLYETDSDNIKEVAVKLFSESRNVFVLEYDANRRVAFGFMEDKKDDSLSTWRFFFIDELIELGYEMDLDFEDKIISFQGIISEKEVEHV